MMDKDLVVFFSRTGHTRALAEELGRACDADVDEIHERHGRAGIMGFLRSGYEALKRVEPLLLPPGRDPRDYRRIIVGGPVWAALPCSPVRAYLAHHKTEFRNVAFFCTYGGRGAEQALAEMARIVGRRPSATLAVLDRDIDAHRENVAPFVKTLSAAH